MYRWTGATRCGCFPSLLPPFLALLLAKEGAAEAGIFDTYATPAGFVRLLVGFCPASTVPSLSLSASPPDHHGSLAMGTLRIYPHGRASAQADHRALVERARLAYHDEARFLAHFRFLCLTGAFIEQARRRENSGWGKRWRGSREKLLVCMSAG